jgi:hypothetical protein
MVVNSTNTNKATSPQARATHDIIYATHDIGVESQQHPPQAIVYYTQKSVEYIANIHRL